jgi:ribosomal protein S18 acetylase RimI-like enzyme
MVTLEEVEGSRERFVPLLLEADESEGVVRSYLEQGIMYVIANDGIEVGVVLTIFHGDDLEIKNIALVPERRGRGIGTAVLELAVELAREACASRLIVGTADSSPGTVRFYERAGFLRYGVREGFFDAYPEPIWENGIRARDMIMLERRPT